MLNSTLILLGLINTYNFWSVKLVFDALGDFLGLWMDLPVFKNVD